MTPDPAPLPVPAEALPRPSVRPRRMAGPIAAIALVLVLAGLGAFALARGGPRAKAAGPAGGAQGPVRVRVELVQPTEFAPIVNAEGSLLPNESVQIVSELSRRLLKVHFQDGDEVKRGAPLFTLDASELGAARERIVAERALALRNFERQEALKRDALTSVQDWDVARAKVDSLAAQQRELEATLGKTRIVAPFAGKLGLRQVSEGAWVNAATPLVSLYDTSRLKVDFRLPERYAGVLAVGQPFAFTVDGRTERFAGKIAAIEPGVEAATRSVVVRGLIEPPQGLTPGVFAHVELKLPGTQGLFVPSIAVLANLAGHRVFVAEAGKAKAVDVELGVRTADRVEIVKGLAPGARVIVTNMLRLRPGAPVEVVANPPDTAP